MPRLARIVCPGVPHHVTQRGNRRAQVFFSDWDCLDYLCYLREYTERHKLDVLAYCLMPNHVHMVVVPANAFSMQRVMRPLHMRYAQRFNRARGSNGLVWQGRYFSSALDETYLWNAIRYVELNPVRGNLTDRAEAYPWSSAAAHCGLRSDSVLTTEPFWQLRMDGVGDWSAWLAEGDESDSLSVLRLHAGQGLPCGSPAFIETLEEVARRPLRHRQRGRPRKVRDEKG